MPTMNAITAAELASMRADAQALLDQSCDIYRKSETQDTYGSQTPAWSKIATVKAGLSQPTATQMQNYNALIGSLSVWQVRLPYGQDVQHDDHLLIGAQTLEVHVILNPRSYASIVTVLAAEVK